MRWQPFGYGARRQHDDPITTGIGIAIIEALGLAGSIGFASATTIGTVVVGAALIGANFLLSRPNGQGGVSNFAATQVNSQEIRLNQRQPRPQKKIIYGRALVGGALNFEKVKAPYLYHQWLVAAHEIDGFEEIRIGRDRLAFSEIGNVLPGGILVPIGVRQADESVINTPNYVSNLQVSLRRGTASQTIDPLLAAGFSHLESDFRQRGIATLAARYRYPGTTYDDFQEVWGNVRAPNILGVVRGRKVYDPRDPEQMMWTDARDIDEVAAAEDTWKWSNNASLVQADYLVQPFGGRIAPTSMRYDDIADAANYDDELIGTKSGEFIRRHTIDCAISIGQQPVEVLRQLLTANRGFVAQRGGQVSVLSSRPRDPVLTITDNLIVGAIEYSHDKPKRDTTNRVFSRFIAEEREYMPVDGPTLEDEDQQEEDGEILPATLDLSCTLDHRRVQRLQKAWLASSRLGRSLAVTVSLDALAMAADDLIGRPVNVQSDIMPMGNGRYRVLDMGFAEGFASIVLQLAEYDPSIERDWNPETDEQDFEVEQLDLT